MRAARVAAVTTGAAVTVAVVAWVLAGRPMAPQTAVAALGAPPALLLVGGVLRRAGPAAAGALLAGALVVGVERELTVQAAVAGPALVLGLQLSLAPSGPDAPDARRRDAARYARLVASAGLAAVVLLGVRRLAVGAAPHPAFAVGALAVVAGTAWLLAAALRDGPPDAEGASGGGPPRAGVARDGPDRRDERRP